VQAVILAGGLGKRLMPLTAALPKPLLPLGEISILEHQIVKLRDAGCSEVFVATYHKADLIAGALGRGEKLGVHIYCSCESKPLGTAGPLKLLEAQLDGPFIVMNGDIITDLDLRCFYNLACAYGADLTVATKVITTPFRFSDVKVNDRSELVSIVEKPDFHIEVLAGIYCMTVRVLELIPTDVYFGMDQLLHKLLSLRRPVYRHLIQEYWLDIGQIDDYRKARIRHATKCNGSR